VNRLFRRNLRTRLTALYTLLLAAALLLYAGCISAFFLHNLREQLSASLDRDVETVEGALAVDSNGQLQLSSQEGEADEDEPDHGYLLEVWSGDGRLLYQTERLRNQRLGPQPEQTSTFQHEERSFQLASGLRVRSIDRIHHLPDGQSVIVRLALSEEPIWREFWKMVAVLGIGLPLALIFIAAAGYLVAARALRPVDAMARRASQITAEHLDERLTIDNPGDELGQLGTAFNKTLARLESSFGQLRRFTADASHELRTPLTAIQSVGEVSLRKPGDTTYYRDIIGSMLEETHRLTQLVDSLLVMSRADAGRVQLHPAEVNLLALASELAGLLEVLAEEKQQTIETEGEGSLMLMADRTLLRQALVNLIDNALKYSPSGGRICIRVADQGSSAVIEVQDSGPGIPLEHRDRIFERFYRVDQARTRLEGGTGLGLSIAQWAVSVHGGTIEVHCPPGSGSIFRIRLPKHFLNAIKPSR
jgi:heavy metal sensor kinase